MVKKFGELCIELRRQLFATEPELALPVARELVAHAAGKTPEELLRDLDLYAPARTEELAREYMAQYLAGKPLAYILGEWSFYGLPMMVTPAVLIPRDDTAAVTDLVLEALRDMEKPRVLDLCTGSGCIGVTVAKLVPEARVTLADLSEDALAVARENAARNGVTRRVSAVRADALQPAPVYLANYDLIVSNPPYITGEEMSELDPSVRDYEPRMALYGGEDGLEFYRGICRYYRHTLRDGGFLCFEFGMGQHDAVGKILTENGFGELRYRKDASNIIRAVIAQKTERN